MSTPRVDDAGASFEGPYPSSFTRDWSRWDEAVSTDRVAELQRDGWTVIDNFMGGGGGANPGAGEGERKGDGGAWAMALREEIKWLAATGLMRPNRTHFSNPKGERYLFSKPNVFEVDLHEADVCRRLPEMRAFFEASATRLAAAFTAKLRETETKGGEAEAETGGVTGRDGGADDAGGGDDAGTAATRGGGGAPAGGNASARLRLYPLREGDDARTVKLQHNLGGGGCFPLHYDNPGPPSNRALTCILYLNPEWREGDGGELQLVPFMRRPVRVAPRHDRLAVFLSDRVLHRVLPSKKERFCLTVWLDGMLESHRLHLKAVRANAPLKALVDALRRLKAETVDTEEDRLVL